MTATRSTGDRPTYTCAQQRAIRGTTHVLLEAGAGSGKTTTLVGKIMHAMGAEVVDGERVAAPCELHQIAAITFTTAAAADLKQSLRRRLRAEAARACDRRWHRAAYEVDRARIGTIHSFCSQILREFGLRAGLDPSFRVLDAGEASAVRAECVRALVLGRLRAGDPAVEELVFQFGPDAVLEMVGDAVNAGDAARRAHERWCGPDGPRTDALRARVLELGGRWHDDVDGDSVRLAATALRLAADARHRVDERLDDEGALDYDALIYRTRDLLRERPDVLRTLRRRLAWLFIDEFQDTDPAQRDIAYLLCGIDASTDGEAPRLCIVGDPKQSIYGFRRADVSLWNQVARDFAAMGADVVPLDVNYRSRSPILGLVNATFGALMPPADDPSVEAPDHEVRYRALGAARAYDGDDGLVELLALPAGKADERRDAEARLIAARIRAMVEDGESVVWDGTAERAPVRWRDVALLFRSMSEVRRYEAELRRLGIPCYVAAGDGFHATREVRDLVLLLRALLDAHDDLAWIGLLRSPLVGLTDEALLRIRHARPGVPFSRALDPSLRSEQAIDLPGEDGPVLAYARGWLAELGALRDRVSNAALVERALDRTGYAAFLLHHAGGDVALANVRKLVRIADARPGDSLAELVAYLEEQATSGAREGDAPLHTAGEDVVVLTTIHGAKGLEWPVVFLCDLDREVGRGAGSPVLLYDADAGIGVKLERERDAESAADEPVRGAYECLCDLAAARDRAEEKRVWYVAATRARDRLVLCAQPPEPPAAEAAERDGKKEPREKLTVARWLLAAVRLDGDRLRYGDAPGAAEQWTGLVTTEVRDDFAVVEPSRPPTWDDIASATPAATDVAWRVAPVAAVPSLFRRSATEVTLLARRPDEHRRAYLLGLRDVADVASAVAQHYARADDAAAPANALDARATGDVVHAVMELDAAELDRDLDAILEREITHRIGGEAAAALPPASVARLRRLIESTRGHVAVARLLGADAVEHELPFTWFLGAAGGPVSVFQGAMDLVARVGGTLEVLDFKTHRIRPGMETATAAEYDLQRDLYVLALGEVLERPSAFSFFFPETGTEVRTTMQAEAMAEARAALVTRLHATTAR